MTPREILELLLENPKRTAGEAIGLVAVLVVIVIGMSVFAGDHIWMETLK